MYTRCVTGLDISFKTLQFRCFFSQTWGLKFLNTSVHRDLFRVNPAHNESNHDRISSARIFFTCSSSPRLHRDAVVRAPGDCTCDVESSSRPTRVHSYTSSLSDPMVWEERSGQMRSRTGYIVWSRSYRFCSNLHLRVAKPRFGLSQLSCRCQ